MIKIILKKTYDDMQSQIAQGEAGTFRENREKNKIKKEFEIYKEEHKAEIDLKNKEITRLENKIETLTKENAKITRLENKIETLAKENAEKNESLELTINEKEELLLSNSSLKKLNRSYLATREKLSKHIKTIRKEHKKEIKELLDKVDAKERVIQEYQRALEDSERKNQIQAEKFKELSKKVEHETIEYENDGLPKTTKQSLRAKRKMRRK